MSLGSRIKIARINLGLTQQELANQINLSKANISKHEADLVEPSIETICKLAIIFSTTVEYLITGNNTAPHNLTNQQKEVLDLAESLNDNDLKRLIEYAELLNRADGKK